MLSVVYADCTFCCVTYTPFMLTVTCCVTYTPFMLNVTFAECHMYAFMLTDTFAECHIKVSHMLTVVLLSVVAPTHPRPTCDRKKFVSNFCEC